jgi:hypothetical protein
MQESYGTNNRPLLISDIRIALDQFSKYYQRRISDNDLDAVADMWHEDLIDHMDGNQFDVVARRYRKNFNRFPRPSDLILCLTDPRFTDQAMSKDKVVLDGVTGRYKWYDDPDGTEYMSLKEFKRRKPEYAAKLDRIDAMNKKTGMTGLKFDLAKVQKHLSQKPKMVYADEVPF